MASREQIILMVIETGEDRLGDILLLRFLFVTGEEQTLRRSTVGVVTPIFFMG